MDDGTYSSWRDIADRFGLDAVCPCCNAIVDLKAIYCSNCNNNLIMGFVDKIDSIKDTVQGILAGSPEARDNDRLLILKVWKVQDKRIANKKTTFVDFAREFIKGRYTDTETIRRTRQKLQSENEELRGGSYGARQKEGEEVKKLI